MVMFASQTQSLHRVCQWERGPRGADRSAISAQEWERLWMLAPINGSPDLARYWTLSWKKFIVPELNAWDCCCLEILGIWGLFFFLYLKGKILFLSLVISSLLLLFVNIVLKSWKRPFLSLFGVWSTMKSARVGVNVAHAFPLKQPVFRIP